jgi:hypothetical protein
MMALPAQGFEIREALLLNTIQDRILARLKGSSQGTSQFGAVLEQMSAKASCPRKTEETTQESGHLEENRLRRAEGTASRPRQTDENHGRQKQEGVARHVSPKDNCGEKSRTSVRERVDGAENPADEATAVERPSVKGRAACLETPKTEVTVRILNAGSDDNLSIAMDGLSEELINSILSGYTEEMGVNQGITLETLKEGAGDGTAAVSTGGCLQLTAKLSSNPNDALAVMDEILSLIATLTEALQKNAPNMVNVQIVEVQLNGRQAIDTFANLLLKEGTRDPATTPQGLPAVFKDLLGETSTEDVPTISGDAVNDMMESGLPEDASLAESLLAKVKVMQSITATPGGAKDTPDRGTDVSLNDKGFGTFADNGTSMQTAIQKQTQAAEGPKTASFSSIVAERLADVAEQLALRDKPLDITLRLKMENGDSLFVGLKDQAGKILVHLRCADQQMFNLLQSQKETIMRHLEAKQVSTSILVSPIEEDMARRQGRERPKNMWGRQRDPFNPYVEIQV